MTEPTSIRSDRLARRAASDMGLFVPTTEENLAIGAAYRARDRATTEAGLQAKPITTWQEIADAVDEPTWQRILNDLSPTTRAECEQIRPPAVLPGVDERQAEALGRLGRAARTNPLVRRSQP